jgi:hypothetical protein
MDKIYLTTDSLNHPVEFGLYHKQKQNTGDGVDLSLLGLNKNINDIKNIQDSSLDIQELEEFCKKHNILAANFKGMNAKSTLRMLKNKMGVIENNDKSKKQILND